jgi:hypothetical protein
MVVTVEGVPKFHCSPGLYKAQKAFRVDAAVAPTNPPKKNGA